MQDIWQSLVTAEIMNLSGRSQLITLPHSASVWYRYRHNDTECFPESHACTWTGVARDALVALGQGGAHSIVVMNDDGTGPEALFSQGAIVNYLFHHLQHFSTIAHLLVQQVSAYSQVGSPRPVQIADDALLLEAFRLVRDEVGALCCSG